MSWKRNTRNVLQREEWDVLRTICRNEKHLVTVYLYGCFTQITWPALRQVSRAECRWLSRGNGKVSRGEGARANEELQWRSTGVGMREGRWLWKMTEYVDEYLDECGRSKSIDRCVWSVWTSRNFEPECLRESRLVITSLPYQPAYQVNCEGANGTTLDQASRGEESRSWSSSQCLDWWLLFTGGLGGKFRKFRFKSWNLDLTEVQLKSSGNQFQLETVRDDQGSHWRFLIEVFDRSSQLKFLIEVLRCGSRLRFSIEVLGWGSWPKF